MIPSPLTLTATINRNILNGSHIIKLFISYLVIRFVIISPRPAKPKYPFAAHSLSQSYILTSTNISRCVDERGSGESRLRDCGTAGKPGEAGNLLNSTGRGHPRP